MVFTKEKRFGAKQVLHSATPFSLARSSIKFDQICRNNWWAPDKMESHKRNLLQRACHEGVFWISRKRSLAQRSLAVNCSAVWEWTSSFESDFSFFWTDFAFEMNFPFFSFRSDPSFSFEIDFSIRNIFHVLTWRIPAIFLRYWAEVLSQPTSREVNPLHAHALSARSQPTREKSTHQNQNAMCTPQYCTHPNIHMMQNFLRTLRQNAVFHGSSKHFETQNAMCTRFGRTCPSELLEAKPQGHSASNTMFEWAIRRPNAMCTQFGSTCLSELLEAKPQGHSASNPMYEWAIRRPNTMRTQFGSTCPSELLKAQSTACKLQTQRSSEQSEGQTQCARSSAAQVRANFLNLKSYG